MLCDSNCEWSIHRLHSLTVVVQARCWHELCTPTLYCAILLRQPQSSGDPPSRSKALSRPSYKVVGSGVGGCAGVFFATPGGTEEHTEGLDPGLQSFFIEKLPGRIELVLE